MTRAERLAGLVAERALDMLFVSDLVNVRYLTGFTGTNGGLPCRRDRADLLHRLRYAERAEQEVGAEWERPEAERELILQIADRMRKVGFEDLVSVRQLARIEAATADESDLVPAGDLVEQLRAVGYWEPEAIAAPPSSPTASTAGDRARPRGQDRAGSRPRLRGADPVRRGAVVPADRGGRGERGVAARRARRARDRIW